MTVPRTIRREHKFDAELKKIEPDDKRADELVEGVEWVLCKKPTAGIHIRGTHVWCFYSRDIPNKRELTVYYTFDSGTVFFVSVTESALAL